MAGRASTPQPPLIARWLLTRLLPTALRESLMGDLEEVFHDEVLSGLGSRRAHAWYWTEALRTVLTLRMPAPFRPAGLHSRGSRMHDLLTDLLFGVRLLARRPGFALLTILTLAVGIGATTAIFSVVDPILFRSLPYPHAERLFFLHERDVNGTSSRMGFATYLDIARESHSFDAVAATGSGLSVIAGRGEPEQLSAQRVAQPYFTVLGVRPALGRDFRPADDQPGAPRVVILSHGLWRRRFGGDSSIVGRPVTLDGLSYDVIGVMPADFENVVDPTAQMWRPLRYAVTQSWACRTCRHLRAVARLRAGVTGAQAQRDLNVISHNLVRAYPNEYSTEGILLISVRSEITRGIRPVLFAILGAVGLVLLITCANVASLLLARAGQRQGEFAIRLALGAGRRRVVRQLLTESVVVALAGGAAGVVLASVGLRFLLRLGPGDLPRLGVVQIDPRVLGFALIITSVAGILAGLAPALHAARRDLHGAIKQAGRHGGPPRFTRRALVVTEIGLALVLLAGAGLLLRSLDHLLAVDPGFDPAHVLSMHVVVSGPRYNDDAVTRAFFRDARQAVLAVPGVESAGFVSQLPLGGNFDQYGILIESQPLDNPELAPAADRYAVSPGYLETMKISIIRGRGVHEQDAADAPAVVLINRAFAARAWPGRDPLGERVRLGDPNGPWRTIVGIVDDVRHVSLDGEQSNQIYIPEAQWLAADFMMALVARTRGAPAQFATAVRNAIWSVDKDQPITQVATMEQVVAQSAVRRRFALVLFEVFAGAAVLLALAGMYGVLSGMVGERTREIGIRGALGASRGHIVGLVVRQGVALAAMGIVLGGAAAIGLERFIATLLFDISPADPFTLGGVMLILSTVALAACWVPAWRAARVDPVKALRQD